MNQAQVKRFYHGRFKNIRGESGSAELLMLFQFLRLLTNKAPFPFKCFVFLMGHYFHCLSKVHLINLSLVKEQIYCEVYILMILQVLLRATLSLAQSVGEKALFFLTIFRKPPFASQTIVYSL